MGCMSRSFVLPVRIGRMLEIPEWATALDGWNDGEVIRRRRRRCRPLKGPGVPRVAARSLALEVRPHEIRHENHDTQRSKEYGDADDDIPHVPSAARAIGSDSTARTQ